MQNKRWKRFFKNATDVANRHLLVSGNQSLEIEKTEMPAVGRDYTIPYRIRLIM